MTVCRISLLLFCLPLACLAQSSRSAEGLLALYDFREVKDGWIRDQSGHQEPVDLKIGNPSAVQHAKGALEIKSKASIQSEDASRRLAQAISQSGEFTLEAWIRPANTKQEGPARIVTLSRNSSERNFTLGQEKDQFDMRFRTTETSKNGLPSTSTARKSLEPKLTHVVYSKDSHGRARIFLDGEVVADQKVSGAMKNWSDSYRLALGDELSGDRPWLGTYYLVALYSRELEPSEIRTHFQAGIEAETPAIEKIVEKREQQAQEHFFTTQVAPLLAEHCLECHDSSTRKGKLDLSRQDEAMKEAIVAGNFAQSALWESIEFDDMPHERPSLSAEEKQVLKQWIEEGAVWARDRIDPAIYSRGGSEDQVWVQRLTVSEYIETVRATVGVDIGPEAREILPPEVRADGFSNTSYNLNVDLKHVEAYGRLAELIVDRMDPEEFAKKFSKRQSMEDDPMRDLIADMGLRVLRGPLNDQEIVLYRGITTTVAAAGGDFEEAVALVLEAMLQSPRFIYRLERQTGNGGLARVDPYELASRMSYIIWGGPPDESLLQAAKEQWLLDPETVEGQINRMLNDPRARTRSLEFASEWLHLDRLANMRPNSGKFPEWSSQLGEDMRAETLAFFEEVIWERRLPMSELLNAPFTITTPRLAQHYGLEPKGDGAVLYDLSAVKGRGGLLTQGSVLTIGGDEASMVARGLFVLHDLLHGAVKDPPPCVDTTPVATKAGLTQRAIAQDRIANKNCGGCHSKFEPLAFGLEKFDGIGMFHQQDEHGNLLRDDGEILFPGEAEPIPYDSSEELMNLLAQSDRVRECITWKLAQFALGRPLTALDAPILDQIQAKAEGGTYQALIKALILSDLVQKTRTVADPS